MSNSLRQRGMTLAEVVIAITLTAMVASSTVTILRSMTAARTRVDRQASLQQQARLGVAAIASALRDAYRTDGNDWVLEGLSDSSDGPPAERIRFFTVSRLTLRRGRGEGDVRECQFSLAKAPDEKLLVLVRRMDPTRNLPPDGGGILQRIAGNAVSLDFQFHDGTAWRDTWPVDYRAWPTAIAVQLVVADEADPKVTASARAMVGYTYQPVKSEQEAAQQESAAQTTQGQQQQQGGTGASSGGGR